MKKHISILLLILGILVVSSTMVMAGANPGTGIKGTSHDLSTATGKGGLWDAGVAADSPLDRICIYCHAPHNTMTAAQAVTAGVTYYPLWNHDVTIQSFTPYSNTATGYLPGTISHQLNALQTMPGGISKLCLSCHDGSVAVSSYGNLGNGFSSSQHTGTSFASGRILIGAGGNLQNHHPIGFNYDAVAILDDEIRDSGNALLGNNAYGLTIADLLYGGNVECASCHDVHNTKNTGTKFTWVEDDGSNLCLSCHAK
jgi:predicted CXXCH cytochrome family protein